MVRVSEKFLQQITQLAKDGSSTISAFLARITNVSDPVDPQDVATKNYVDSLSVGLAILDEGITVDGYTQILNFEGTGVSAVQDAPGTVTVTISSATASLEDTLLVGNETGSTPIIVWPDSAGSWIQGVDSATSNPAEALFIRGGDNTSTGIGNHITLRGGSASDPGSNAGNAYLQGGSVDGSVFGATIRATGASGLLAGNFSIEGANASGFQQTTTCDIRAGSHSGALPGGSLLVTAGGSNSNVGGSVDIYAGDSVSLVGGTLTLRSGDGGVFGGGVYIRGGDIPTGNGVPGSVSIRGGEGLDLGNNGGTITLAGGQAGNGGGDALLIGGQGISGAGGDARVQGGLGATLQGTAELLAGSSATPGTTGGDANVVAGFGDLLGGQARLESGSSNNSAGQVYIRGGDGYYTGGVIQGIAGSVSFDGAEGAAVVFTAGGSFGINGLGGQVQIIGGAAQGSGGNGTGGNVSLYAGAGDISGGQVFLFGGDATNNDGVGGDVEIQPGNATTGGTSQGGSTYIRTGDGDTPGSIVLDAGEPLTWPTADGYSGSVMTTDGYGTLSLVEPNDLVFSVSESNNIRLKVAPQGNGTVTSLATASNVNVDITLSEDGSYDFFVMVRLKLVASTRRTVAARICGNRESGTLTMEGSQVDVNMGGLTSGITITLTATSGNLRVNVANATGSTVNGYVHVGWVLEDLIP